MTGPDPVQPHCGIMAQTYMICVTKSSKNSGCGRRYCFNWENFASPIAKNIDYIMQLVLDFVTKIT
jgi:hypothetical protein